jgi:hypothetical protein
MNKKILVISMLMLMMCAMAASVFAQELEWQYEVTVNYQKIGSGSNNFGKMTYTIWATSAREAEAKAMELCRYDVEIKGLGRITSCAAPNATNKSRPAQ